MPEISTRINAVIAYLFLGPLLLLAKNGTPLAEPYVKWHAKRASIILFIWILAFIVYIFFKQILTFEIFSISLNDIVLTIMVSSIIIALMLWAYRAFNWIPTEAFSWKSFRMPEGTIISWIYSEEDKVRIIASFIPFIGIIIANKYLKNETIIGRKLSNTAIFIILTSTLLFWWSSTLLTVFFIIIYIWLIVTTAVYMFGFSRFLNFKFYNSIPTYIEFDAFIKAGFAIVFDFFRIAFGGIKKINFQEEYSKYLEKNKLVHSAKLPYFAPNWIICLPILNIITIPSLWQDKYREYVPLILQWIILTLLTWLIIFFQSTDSLLWLYLLFPIITLCVENRNNLLVRAPFTSIAIDINLLFVRSQEKLADIKESGEEKVSYKYEVGEEK